MTLLHNNVKFERIMNSEKCFRCQNKKEKGVAFCDSCLNQLPNDVLYDLTHEQNTHVKVAAFADAMLYLSNDWRNQCL